MTDFLANQADSQVETIELKTRIEIPGPRFTGVCRDQNTEMVGLDMPRLEVVEIRDATVLGGTNFILTGGMAVHPDLFVPSRDTSPAELHGGASINPLTHQLKLYLPRRIPKGNRCISLLGQCTGNYAHWLTETLPKLMIVDAIAKYRHLPLLVDDWIHPNFYDSINLLSREPRELVSVARFRPYKVSSVVDVSPPAYTPPEYRAYMATKELVKTTHEVFSFSRRALEMLREAAWKAVTSKAVSSGTDSKKRRKLYLRREKESCGNPRMIGNIEAVEKLIMRFGFEPIDPGKLSFSEQVTVFMNAETVVSPVGAALANMIFMPPGGEIIALAPRYENANYYYFSNLAGVLNHKLVYALGPQKMRGDHPLHKDYDVDMDELSDALSNLNL
jgi:capsular polysaccharide biosynthesis protein